ncbi:MAG TPA: hypothetical protein VFT55_05875 [Planctomycetota bacterium]|nr:hypothetical protein [Planctomycetota bacterium]
MRKARPCCRIGSVLVLVTSLHAQTPTRHVDTVMQDKDLLALQWRRSDKGVLECALADDKAPEWAPLFREGVFAGLQTSGSFGLLSLLLHSGDLLSLTSGERHLSRIGVATVTPELRQYIAVPLPDALAELAVLDRMVAIDVLVARGAKDAVAELKHLAGDAALPAPLRERAAGAVTRLEGGTSTARPRLDAKTLRLPAEADVYVVVDNAALTSMNFLLELGRFTGLLSSAYVIDTLKNPTPHDLMIGQCESEQVTEIPFELAREIGNFRIDQICLAVRLPRKKGDEPEVSVHAAGQFEPKGIEAMLTSLGVQAHVELQVTATGITASNKGLTLAPDETRAKALLDLTGHAVRVLVPSGSPLLAQMRPFGLPPTESLDLRFGIGANLRCEAVLTVPAGQEAERWQESTQRVLEREIADKLGDAEERLGLGAGTLAMKFAPAAGKLVVSTEVALDRLPKMEQAKKLCSGLLPGAPR